ncbi:hypothetical protein KSP39_PZI004867 [Platanthera zijinensis]|uniref:Uncharacterized protein n=1 Tax=Platanthera zijinensis TaxID=2320716 RepID=A0AAP0GD76_9ASPA
MGINPFRLSFSCAITFRGGPPARRSRLPKYSVIVVGRTISASRISDHPEFNSTSLFYSHHDGGGTCYGQHVCCQRDCFAAAIHGRSSVAWFGSDIGGQHPRPICRGAVFPSGEGAAQLLVDQSSRALPREIGDW